MRSTIKGLGGTTLVLLPILTARTVMENFHPKLHTTVWSGLIGKELITPWRELNWRSGRKSSRKAFLLSSRRCSINTHYYKRCRGHTKVFRNIYLYWAMSLIVFCFVFLFFSDCGVEPRLLPPPLDSITDLENVVTGWSAYYKLLIKTSLSKFMESVKVL